MQPCEGVSPSDPLGRSSRQIGHGLGIDFEVPEGVVTLLNLTQFQAGDTFKLIYSVGEVIPGPILNIGNPNCRVRVSRPMHEFIDAGCQQGPSHHIALGSKYPPAEPEALRLLAPQRGLTAADQNQNPRLATSVRIGKRGKGMGGADSRSCQTSTATPAEPGDLLTELVTMARRWRPSLKQ